MTPMGVIFRSAFTARPYKDAQAKMKSTPTAISAMLRSPTEAFFSSVVALVH